MPACKHSEYTARFPIGTDVTYTLDHDPKPHRARVAGHPTVFHAHIELCVVLLDNGLVVPCSRLRAVDPDAE